MNDKLTEVIFILDMSGSMGPFTADTIGGYNTLLNEQKEKDGDANVTTILFDDRYIVLHDRVNIKDVKDITNKEYAPLGMTALLDAVGKTIVSAGQKLAAMDEKDRPGTVIVTIITDGYENASKEYTWKQVQSMIKEQREKYSWVFTFIGANIDVMKVSENLGIDSRLAKSYKASKKGVDSVYKAMSKSVAYMRTAYAGTAMNEEAREATLDNMSVMMDEDIVNDEN